MPKNLTSEQINQFKLLGHISPVRVIGLNNASACRDSLEAYEKQLGHPVQGPLRTKPHLMFPWVDKLMRNNTVLDCVEDLIGADILCWNSWFWIKEANTSSYVSWHQDSQYWGLDTSQLVTAWLALSPASVESGCMRVLPGSHRGDPLNHVDLYHDDNLLTRGQEILNVDESRAVSMPLDTGDMSFHNIGIAHASTPNHTEDRRIGLSFHYMPTSTRQLKSEWDCAALVRGEDKFGHFEHTPAPQTDLDPVTMAYHERATKVMREILFQGAEKVRPTI
ncbi:MAG: non-heme Fe2+,alpha-ketoglutarate-dependent halogenase [Parasphingorhabdus sp.]|jgi:non-heme Fe2+,alpha-ketoglutarate-dependent halogenase